MLSLALGAAATGGLYWMLQRWQFADWLWPISAALVAILDRRHLAAYFGWPTIASMYRMNPLVAALGPFFAALLCIHRWEAGKGARWLGLGGVLLVSTGASQAFLLAHVLACLWGTAALLWARGRGGRFAQATAVLTLATAPLLALLATSGRASAQVQLRWPVAPAEAVLRSDLGDGTVGKSMEALLAGEAGPGDLLLYGLAVAPAFLLAATGARALGVRRVLAALGGEASGLRTTLAMFVVSGLLLALTLVITAVGYDARTQYNNAAWFAVQSKHLMWLFAVDQVRRFWPRLRSFGRLALVAAVVGVSLPSTIEFLRGKTWSFPLLRISPEKLRLAEAVGAQARPGDVLLAPGELCRLIISLTPTRSPCLDIHPKFFVHPKRLAREQDALGVFWRGLQAGRLHERTVERFGATWLVTDARVRLPPGRLGLEPRFVGKDHILYKVSGRTRRSPGLDSPADDNLEGAVPPGPARGVN